MTVSSLFSENSFEATDCLFPEFILEYKSVQKEKKTDYHRDIFHMTLLDGVTLSENYGMPIIEPCDSKIPNSLITFPEARSLYNKGKCISSTVHFYIEDSAFSCINSSTDSYLPIFTSTGSIIGPDFSIQIDMPISLKMFNSYQNKLLTRHYQIKGVNVFPNIVWAEPNSYDYYFEGYPEKSVVAVNSTGIIGNPKSVYFWQKGYEEMIERIHPVHIIRYGTPIPGELEAISTYYPNNHLNRMRYGR